MELVLLTQIAATLFMVGLIWFVQIVHYPLFDRVDRPTFTAFEAEHRRRTSFVVVAPMVLEMATALLLLAWRPAAIPRWQPWLGFALLVVVWLSTALGQVPQHETLSKGFDESAYHRLVASNWVRTIVWSLRGALVLWMAAALMGDCR